MTDEMLTTSEAARGGIMNTKKIAELIRTFADTYYSSGHPDLVQAGHDWLMEIAEELDQPAPRPLLADAEVGWVCKHRNGKYSQITQIKPCVTLGNLYGWITSYDNTRGTFTIDGRFSVFPDDRDIIHCEPLAPEGTAEWALQQMKLGKTVCHPIDDKPHRCRITDDKIVCDYCGQVFDIAKWTSGCLQQSGWCIYDPAKPEPAFAVGDWVTDGVVTGKITSWGMGMAYVKCDDKGYHLDIANLRKLSTSEVRVKITLEGTVKPCSVDTFELCTNEGSYWIGWKELDPDTAKLVRVLVGK